MTAEATVTTDVQNKDSNGIKKHVKRESKHYSNDDIDLSRTKNNQYFDYRNGLTETELLEADFLPQLEKMNERNLDRHPERVKTLDEYVGNMKGVPFKTMVVTIGNHENYNDEFMNDPEIIEAINNSYNDFAKKFNSKFGEHLTITEQSTHMDESTPHSHMTLYTHGKTGKAGKHSTSLNANLKSEYAKQNPGQKVPTDTRKIMSWWRKQTDEMMIQCLNENGFDMKLNRTGIHVASFDDYKKIMESSEQLQKQNVETKSQLVEQSKQLNKKAKQIKNDQTEIKQVKNDLLDQITEANPSQRFRLPSCNYDEDEFDENQNFVDDSSEPISTTRGRQQFQTLRVSRLHKILNIVVAKSLETLKTAKNALKIEIIKLEQDKAKIEQSTGEPKIKLSTATTMLKNYYSVVNSAKPEDRIKKQTFENYFIRKTLEGFDNAGMITNIKNLDTKPNVHATLFNLETNAVNASRKASTNKNQLDR